MKSTFLLAILLACGTACGTTPKPDTRCDLAFVGGNGQEVCFERTDGRGHKQPFTDADKKIVEDALQHAK